MMSYISSLPSSVQSQSQLAASAMYPSSQMSSQTYLSRVPSLPENMYGTNQLYPQTSGLRTETSGYGYQMPSHADQLKAPSSLGHHYFVDHMMNPHPYSALYPGFDINAIRRKNATRETTGPLKSWLRQHRKNPYPTKGEKVMMAIGTRMTLTQVSTWFANARRRMKKDKLDDENDDTDDLHEIDIEDKRERSGSLSSRVSHTSSEADTSKDLSDVSDIDIEDVSLRIRPAKKCVQRLFSPDLRNDHLLDPSSSPETVPERSSDKHPELSPASCLPPLSEMVRGSSNIPVTDLTSQKPKIWSISEIIGSSAKTITTSTDYVTPNFEHHSGLYYNGLASYATYPEVTSAYPYTSDTSFTKDYNVQFL